MSYVVYYEYNGCIHDFSQVPSNDFLDRIESRYKELGEKVQNFKQHIPKDKLQLFHDGNNSLLVVRILEESQLVYQTALKCCCIFQNNMEL